MIITALTWAGWSTEEIAAVTGYTFHTVTKYRRWHPDCQEMDRVIRERIANWATREHMQKLFQGGTQDSSDIHRLTRAMAGDVSIADGLTRRPCLDCPLFEDTGPQDGQQPSVQDSDRGDKQSQTPDNGQNRST